jgi:hypothetical protein
MDGKEYTANFDNAGVWMETEYETNMVLTPQKDMDIFPM